MKPDRGTIYSMRGLRRITSARPTARIRLASLAATALVGSLIVIWMSLTTWERLEHLQKEFAGLKADSFYYGVRMRGRVQGLNDTLLNYRLRGDQADYGRFTNELVELGKWFDANKPLASTQLERAFFHKVGVAYSGYVLDSLAVLEANRARRASTQAGEFKDSYQKVQDQSQELLRLCDGFIEEQRTAFDGFLKESQSTLKKFELLLKLSLGLLLLLAASMTIQVYRNMIAPLRDQLTESQAIIARQEKLASLGVLGAGVAHEIRNPLTAIKFRLFSLRKTLPGAGVDNEDANMIASEISRLERIVKDFLKFARPSEPELVIIPAARLVNEVSELLKPQLEKSQIAVHVEVGEPAWVRADTQQLKQVLINLMQNAADSIGRNGTITLRVGSETESPLQADHSSVALEVMDSGKGIPEDVQKRLFDPFFTTKEGGTGLGLAIAARIVEKHDGELRYETRLNHGTIFTMVLPRVEENEAQNPDH